MKKTSIAECPETKAEHGAFGYRRKRLGDAAGAQRIGCSWTEIQSGKKAFPFHFHTANEEAVYILEGEGVSVYPDSNKIGAYGKSVPGARGIYRTADDVDYYEGEE